MEELDVYYHDGARQRREVKDETFEQIYDKAGVPAEMRKPGNHFFVTEGPKDGPLELWPIPAEIAIEGVAYALRENGALVAKTATVYPDVRLDNMARVDEGARLFNDVSVGERSTVGKKAILRENAWVSHDVQIGENTEVGDSTRIHAKSVIENDSYVGSHVDISGEVKIGHHVRIEHEASVGGNTLIEPSAVVAEEAKVGDRNRIGNSARIEQGVRMGNDVKVDPHAHVKRRKIKTGTIVTAHRGPILKAKFRGSAEGEA